MAYNAERTVASVLQRIPENLIERYDVEVLVIDDANPDQTFELASAAGTHSRLPFRLRIYKNPVNQGYGGNQKIGYWYALDNDFDYVALVHGDGQYVPEYLPELLEPLERDEADAVFGSRMLMAGEALVGGKPLYKHAGNVAFFLTRLSLLFGSFNYGKRGILDLTHKRLSTLKSILVRCSVDERRAI